EANFDGSSGNTDDEYFEGEEDSTNISLAKNSKNLSIYGRLKSAIKKIRKSNILLDSLKHFCESHQIPSLALINDMPVRWNSTF
ncbi:unnamed protein product, partial [Allacma fusca]